MPRPGTTRMFAAVVPGLAALVSRDLAQLPGVHVTGAGLDGRSDVILLDVDRGCRAGLRSLRTIEDLFIEVGRTARSSGEHPAGVAGRVWRPEGVEKALSAWSAEVRPLARGMTYRVVVRVQDERSAWRTELRRGLIRAIAADRPRWKTADPAQVEVWISEYQPGRLVAGLRLADPSARQRAGQSPERPDALRPTVAALMVGLAGEPRDVLLDPCCGAGTILGQALAAGWPDVQGTDIDPGAVEIARRNVPRAGVIKGDARSIDLPDESAGAVVSRLPTGPRYEVEGSMRTWMGAVLREMTRVTGPGGRVVLLAPVVPVSVMPKALRVTGQEPLRLLGTKTTLWICDRK
jgi:SAM-dependent methyltransferase